MAEDEPGTHGDVRSDPDRGPARRERKWPLSAIVGVAVASSLALVLLVMNLLGIQVADATYDANVGGSLAEWFGALSTLVTVPVAVFVGVRQLRSSGEQIELGRRQLALEEIERAGRRGAEQAIMRDAVRLRVLVLNAADAADLATAAELQAISRWRDEYRQRGWVPDDDGAGWTQGTLHRSNADLLDAEPSPLVPKPWFLAAECRNTGAVTVVLTEWTVRAPGGSSAPVGTGSRDELRHGEQVRRRIGPEAGLVAAYAKLADAEADAAGIHLAVNGWDAADRRLELSHPRWE
jgi:hypothetical protein